MSSKEKIFPSKVKYYLFKSNTNEFIEFLNIKSKK